VTLALLQLQISHGAVPSSPVDLILDATPVTQGVLLVLVFLSLLSWSIMFGVWRSLKKAAKSADKFWAEFEHVSRLEDAATLAKKSKPSALPRLFMRAVRFVADARVANQQVLERATTPGGGGDAPAAATLSGSQIETLHLLLDADASDERDRLGRFLPWLATIGSVSPLIGLLGTVLGVIEAFLGIASKGSGNLSAVAPGVGEALTATAAALAVAIPATFGYNIFAARLNRFDGRMERFGTAVIALLVREGRI
jgi:biopolymer transport protein TolQ